LERSENARILLLAATSSRTAPALGTQTIPANGLNQASAVNSVATTHDSRGNMTGDGTASYGYTSDNLMTTGPGGIPLYYDPLNRLVQGPDHRSRASPMTGPT
jgi:hypothetical protein